MRTPIILFFLFPILLNAQKISEVEIVNFDAPFNTILLSIDNKIVEYEITEKTKFRSNKSGDLPQRYFLSGSYVDLDYQIEGRQRIAKSLKLLSDYVPGREQVKGILESYDGDEAFIDGRRVVLDESTKLTCEGTTKCGCTKGMVYLDFKEMRLGDFMQVRGDATKDGIIRANEIKVCQNNYDKFDQKLQETISAAITDHTITVDAPSTINAPANSLYKGKIAIGAFEYKLHDNIYLQGYINIIGKKLLPEYAKSTEYKERLKIRFRFYVIDNPIPNAFAFPNGMVFITKGLLKVIENEAQLATVLGHEIAHVTYAHGATRMENDDYLDSKFFQSGARKIVKFVIPQNGKGIVGDALEGVGDAILATKPSDIANIYNQASETQADRIGLYYAYQAGYDVRESVSFWKKMNQLTENETFVTSLKGDFKKMILDIDLEVGGKIGSNIASSISETMTENFLNTVYTSHPNCKRRVRDINDLLNTVYEDLNLDLVIGKEGYQKAMNNL